MLPKKPATMTVGKLSARGIEILSRFIESHALLRNSIFRAFQLSLKIAESFGGFEFRILFNNNHQTGKRGRQSILRLLEALKCGRIVGNIAERARTDLPDFRARFGNGRQSVLLELRGAFYGVHKIRNQIRATLILYSQPAPIGLAWPDPD